MKTDEMLEDLTARLYAKNMQDLRQIGRAVGLARPSNTAKEIVVNTIMSVADGSFTPGPRSARGAPPKSKDYDRELVADIEKCRAYYLALRRGEGLAPDHDKLYVSDGMEEDGSCAGILERAEKRWFLRVGGCRITGKDVAVQESFVNRYHLREGDRVTGKATRKRPDQGYGLVSIGTVNGFIPDAMPDREDFSDFIPDYPRKAFTLGRNGGDLTGRMLDFFLPLGAGQRVLITGGAQSGKTELIKAIGAGLCANHPQAATTVLLLGARPEERNDMSRTLNGAEVFTTGLEDGEYLHRHAALLALKMARRQVELGNDVVLLVDGMNKLLPSDGGDCSELIKLFASAGNFGRKGSLTVVGVLNADTDAKILELVSAAVNMKIVLSEEGALLRLFPALDLKKCFSAKPELLVGREQLSAATVLRMQCVGAEGLYAVRKIFASTTDNASVTEKYKD